MLEKRFLHIMPDDKFLDHFIEQSEAVAPGKSTYWLKLDKDGIPTYVKSGLVERRYWKDIKLAELIQVANQFSHIILHGFQLDLHSFITGISQGVYVTWIFWGYEGYQAKGNPDQWMLPQTRKLQYQIRYAGVSAPRKLYKMIRSVWFSQRKTALARKIVQRINCCATWVQHDYYMVKQFNPNMAYKAYSYYTIEQLCLDAYRTDRQQYKKIWIGNSAAETNNHIDALEVLAKKKWDGEIYLPLSYNGTPRYKQEVIKKGTELFGSKFIPITEFMPLREYQDLLNQCGIVYMNHIRQQAAGNIFTALYLGKEVVLHPQSNLYKTLKDWGIQVRSDIESIIHNSEDGHSVVESNRAILKKHLSIEEVKNCIASIYNI